MARVLFTTKAFYFNMLFKIVILIIFRFLSVVVSVLGVVLKDLEKKLHIHVSFPELFFLLNFTAVHVFTLQHSVSVVLWYLRLAIIASQ